MGPAAGGGLPVALCSRDGDVPLLGIPCQHCPRGSCSAGPLVRGAGTQEHPLCAPAMARFCRRSSRARKLLMRRPPVTPCAADPAPQLPPGCRPDGLLQDRPRIRLPATGTGKLEDQREPTHKWAAAPSGHASAWIVICFGMGLLFTNGQNVRAAAATEHSPGVGSGLSADGRPPASGPQPEAVYSADDLRRGPGGPAARPRLPWRAMFLGSRRGSSGGNGSILSEAAAQVSGKGHPRRDSLEPDAGPLLPSFPLTRALLPRLNPPHRPGNESKAGATVAPLVLLCLLDLAVICHVDLLYLSSRFRSLSAGLLGILVEWIALVLSGVVAAAFGGIGSLGTLGAGMRATLPEDLARALYLLLQGQ